MKLPKLNLRRAPDFQQQRFARWLTEWRIHQEIGPAATGPVAQGEGTPQPLPVEPFTPSPQPGQLRLLSPRLQPRDTAPVYVAVLRRENAGLFVAPYGRFAEPCLPGELLAMRHASSLRVLCLWNAAVVPADRLARSWLVDRLTADELRDALAVHDHITVNAALPDGLAVRIGPSQWHPADPRVDYVRAERRRLSGLGTLEYPNSSSRWRKAADPRDPYEPTH